MNHTRALVHGLVEIFQECSVEHDLLLYNKGLYDEDLEVLHKYLRKNRNVRVLRLKRNHFTKTGCPTMAAILNDPALCIRELDLSFNRIRSNGMKILAQALRTNTKLRVLSISGIGLGDNGAEYLGNALVENRSLVAMQLDSNTFLKEGRMRGKLRLADGISQNRQLTVVTLGGTCPERLNFARLLIARSGDPRVVLPYNSDKRLKRVIDFVIEHWTSAHKVSAPLVTLPVENLNRILDEFSRFGDDDFAGMEEELIEHLAIYLDDSAAKKVSCTYFEEIQSDLFAKAEAEEEVVEAREDCGGRQQWCWENQLDKVTHLAVFLPDFKKSRQISAVDESEQLERRPHTLFDLQLWRRGGVQHGAIVLCFFLPGYHFSW